MNLKSLSLTLSMSLLAGCQMLNAAAPMPGANQSTQAPQTTTPAATDSLKPTTTYMYVMNGKGKTIDEINLKTMTVTKNVMATGLWPNQLLTSGATTYLVNSGDNNFLKLDLRARTTGGTYNLAVGANPKTVTLLDNNKAVVVNWLHSTLAFVDLGTKAIDATLGLHANASDSAQPANGLAITGGKAYVPAVAYNSDWSYAASKIYVVDLKTRTVLKTIDLSASANPYDITVDPLGKVEVTVSNGISVIDPGTDTVTRTINYGSQPAAVQYVSATKAYAGLGTGLVSFNPTTGAILRDASHSIPTGVSFNYSSTLKLFKNAAYIPNFASDSVVVVDLATETASGSPFSVGSGPQDLTFITVEDQ